MRNRPSWEFVAPGCRNGEALGKIAAPMQYSPAITRVSRRKDIMTDDSQVENTSSGGFRRRQASIRPAIMFPSRHAGRAGRGWPGTALDASLRGAGSIPSAGAGAKLPLDDDKKRLGIACGIGPADPAAKLWQ
jgi:hypothetical protein